jgi:DNA repair protein RecN (Recombination protein N)
MLNFLEIENILLVKKAKIEFENSLCVFTGETGTGKSIILNSILFLLGKKIKVDTKAMLREGEERGYVLGVFDISKNFELKALLKERDLPESDELIIKRVLKKGERERNFINDNLVQGVLLAEVGNFLIEVNRQNEQIALLEKSYHLNVLDLYAEASKELLLTENNYKELSKIKKEITEVQTLLIKFQNDKDYIEHLVKEIEALNLEENEEQILTDKKLAISKELKKVESTKECLNKLFGEKNVRTGFFSALKSFRGAESKEESEIEASINRILYEIDTLEELLNDDIKGQNYTEYDLDKINERLFLIRDIARKYKVAPSELCNFLEEQKKILHQIELSDANLMKLQSLELEATKNYNKLASELSLKRKAASKLLEDAINNEFKDLEMTGADFKVSFNEASPSQNGIDAVEFVISTNVGMKHNSLGKVASGGELSRILLAIKIAILKVNTQETIIFDEIDAGIGGKTSLAVAQKLEELSRTVQVILITHQAQIASKAKVHLKLEKSVIENGVQTSVKALNREEREVEIARMLSGVISKEAIETAKSMIKPT